MNVYDMMKQMDKRYNLSEFEAICLRFGVDPENLGGRNKQGQMREFLQFMRRRNRLQEIIDYLDEPAPQITTAVTHQPSLRKTAAHDLIALARSGNRYKVKRKTFDRINELNDALAMIDAGGRDVDLAQFLTQIAKIVDSAVVEGSYTKIAELSGLIKKNYMRDNVNNSSLNGESKGKHDQNAPLKTTRLRVHELYESLFPALKTLDFSGVVTAYSYLSLDKVERQRSRFTDKQYSHLPTVYYAALEITGEFLESFIDFLSSGDFLEYVSVEGVSSLDGEYFSQSIIPELSKLRDIVGEGRRLLAVDIKSKSADGRNINDSPLAAIWD